MEEVTDRFIILKSVDSGDKNKKLSLFCASLGKVNAVARGVRSEKAKLKFLCLPFCVCDGILFKTGNSYLVKTAKVLHSFMGITQKSEKFEAGNIVLESVLKFYNLTRENFSEAISALEFIENCTENEEIFAIKFLVNLLYSNFNLNLSCCNNCGKQDSEKLFLNFQTGEIKCLNCRAERDVQIKKITAETIEKIANLSYMDLAKFNIETTTLKSLLIFVRELVKGLTDIELNSIKNK